MGDSYIRAPHAGYDLVNPLTDGLITNWNAVETLWNYAFSKCLRVDPKEHPVLAADSEFHPAVMLPPHPFSQPIRIQYI